MRKHSSRFNLIVLLWVEAAFIAVHVALKKPVAEFAWHWALGVTLGAAIAMYAWSIRCPATNCGKRQVFRGWSLFDLRLPADRCYACGAAIE
jgi:hypothetical protein